MSDDLSGTGRAIWEAYGADKLPAPDQALVRELARCADTLDRLDRLVVGKEDVWVVMTFDDMGEVHVSVDKILDQRRNHQLAFKQLVAEVRAAKIPLAGPAAKTLATDEPEDMLAKMRKAKEERERQLG
jgi:hypothetical protein